MNLPARIVGTVGPPRRRARLVRRGMAFAAVVVAAGCDIAGVEVLPAPDVVVAAVSVVFTADPAEPSRNSMQIVALVSRHVGEVPHGVPGALITVTGESGGAVELFEEPYPLEDCTALVMEERFGHIGSCYRAADSPARFLPGEMLSLTVTTVDGLVLRGTSRMPGTFTPLHLTLMDGRCRVDPDTSHRFTWLPVDGAWAHAAEAEINGLSPDLWPSDEPLYLHATVLGRGQPVTGMIFPRDFLLELLADVDHVSLHRKLQTGLPGGARADIVVAAVDRNWANWIREGRANIGGVTVIPSVFGDGTGMFGTAVRWNVSVESRAAQGEGDANDLPLCGPRAA